MKIARKSVALNIVIIVICNIQGVYADQHPNAAPLSYIEIEAKMANLDERFSEHDLLIGNINQQLEELLSVPLNIDRLNNQLDLLEDSLTQLGKDVSENLQESKKTILDLTNFKDKFETEVVEMKGQVRKFAYQYTLVKKQLDYLRSLYEDIKRSETGEDLREGRINRVEESILTSGNELVGMQDEIARLTGEITSRASIVDQYFTDVDRKISAQYIYLAIGLIAFVIILLLLRRRFKFSNTSLSDEISLARNTHDREYNQLDLKLTEILENQTSLTISSSKSFPSDQQDEPDHSLPLKVATEIHRMRKRVVRMPDDTEGVRPLAKALERLEENLAEQGYEIIDLLGKEYIEGMTVSLDFVPDKDLRPDEKIITNVTRPQVNFKGVLVQVAEIVVSTGE